MSGQTAIGATASAGAGTCWSRTFPAVPDQARKARRFLAALISGSPSADDALTCLGELVSNSILHSDSRRPGGAFAVHAEIRAGSLRVEVHDQGGPWAPGPHGRSAPLETGGRGLLIVAALADAWGITPAGPAPARTAWFAMSLLP